MSTFLRTHQYKDIYEELLSKRFHSNHPLYYALGCPNLARLVRRSLGEDGRALYYALGIFKEPAPKIPR